MTGSRLLSKYGDFRIGQRTIVELKIVDAAVELVRGRARYSRRCRSEVVGIEQTSGVGFSATFTPLMNSAASVPSHRPARWIH